LTAQVGIGIGRARVSRGHERPDLVPQEAGAAIDHDHGHRAEEV
jgi:hypothetical protein